MKNFCLLLALLISQLSYSQCDSTLVENGSFTSEEGTSITAPGWIGLSSPDVNDEFGPLNTTPGYVWIGTPLASPSGGTWQNLFDPESVSQTVTLIPGQEYSLCFKYAAQGIVSKGLVFADPVGVDVFINGILSFTSDNDTTQYTWETACFDFTAESNNTIIEFSASGEAYVGLDGVCISLPGTDSVLDETVGQQSVSVSPNPFSDMTTLIISNPGNDLYTFILFDSYGRVAQAPQIIQSNQLVLERKGLTEGVYYYQINGKSSSIGGRLVVE